MRDVVCYNGFTGKAPAGEPSFVTPAEEEIVKLAQKTLELLQNKQTAEQMGREAAQIVAENQGAAVRTVEHLRQIIENRG